MNPAIEAEASPRELLAAAAHLSNCADCRRFVWSLVLATRVLRSVR